MGINLVIKSIQYKYYRSSTRIKVTVAYSYRYNTWPHVKVPTQSILKPYIVFVFKIILVSHQSSTDNFA